MMKYQFVHQRDELLEATITFHSLRKQDLEQLYNTHANKILLLMGLAIKSSKDHFVKSIGRTLALNRLSPQVFKFVGVRVEGTTHVYKFLSEEISFNNRTYSMSAEFTTVAESDHVRLIGASVYGRSR